MSVNEFNSTDATVEQINKTINELNRLRAENIKTLESIVAAQAETIATLKGLLEPRIHRDILALETESPTTPFEGRTLQQEIEAGKKCFEKMVSLQQEQTMALLAKQLEANPERKEKK